MRIKYLYILLLAFFAATIASLGLMYETNQLAWWVTIFTINGIGQLLFHWLKRMDDREQKKREGYHDNY
jgi:4-hydroxybenzoate polyprenyltransferase